MAERIKKREAMGKKPWELKSMSEQAEMLKEKMERFRFKKPGEEEASATTPAQDAPEQAVSTPAPEATPSKPAVARRSARKNKAKKVPPAKVVDTAKAKKESDIEKDYRFHYQNIKYSFASGRSVPQYQAVMNRFAEFESIVEHKTGSRDFVNALTNKFAVDWGDKPYLPELSIKAKVDGGHEAEEEIEGPIEKQQISASVGREGENTKDDVIAIQDLLHEVELLSDQAHTLEQTSVQAANTNKIPEELIEETIAGIEKFQKEVLKLEDASGLIRSINTQEFEQLNSEAVTTDFVKKKASLPNGTQTNTDQSAAAEAASESVEAGELTTSESTEKSEINFANHSGKHNFQSNLLFIRIFLR